MNPFLWQIASCGRAQISTFLPAEDNASGGLSPLSTTDLSMTAISQTSEERVPGKSSLSANASESLYRVADEILRQVVEDLLGSRGPIQTDAQLTHPSELIPGSTIGKHLRSVSGSDFTTQCLCSTAYSFYRFNKTSCRSFQIATATTRARQ